MWFINHIVHMVKRCSGIVGGNFLSCCTEDRKSTPFGTTWCKWQNFSHLFYLYISYNSFGWSIVVHDTRAVWRIKPRVTFPYESVLFLPARVSDISRQSQRRLINHSEDGLIFILKICVFDSALTPGICVVILASTLNCWSNLTSRNPSLVSFETLSLSCT